MTKDTFDWSCGFQLLIVVIGAILTRQFADNKNINLNNEDQIFWKTINQMLILALILKYVVAFLVEYSCTNKNIVWDNIGYTIIVGGLSFSSVIMLNDSFQYDLCYVGQVFALNGFIFQLRQFGFTSKDIFFVRMFTNALYVLSIFSFIVENSIILSIMTILTLKLKVFSLLNIFYLMYKYYIKKPKLELGWKPFILLLMSTVKIISIFLQFYFKNEVATIWHIQEITLLIFLALALPYKLDLLQDSIFCDENNELLHSFSHQLRLEFLKGYLH